MYTILQIIISVVVVYLIFSTIVTTIVEFLSTLFQLRGKVLEKAVLNLFKDKELSKTILQHPRVLNIHAKSKRLASYIPASSIASALIDIVASKNSTNPENKIDKAFENYKLGIDKAGEDNKAILTSLAMRATNAETLGASIEKWFDECMDRTSGEFKRNIRWWTAGVAIVITLAFNIDTLHIIRVAKQDPVLRQKLNDLGDQLLVDSTFKQTVYFEDSDYHDDYENDSSVTALDTATVAAEESEVHAQSPESEFDVRLKQLKYMNKLVGDADLPIGWFIEKDSPFIFELLGWILTALALFAGGPFWFDILKNLINVRNAGPKPASSTSQSK